MTVTKTGLPARDRLRGASGLDSEAQQLRAGASEGVGELHRQSPSRSKLRSGKTARAVASAHRISQEEQEETARQASRQAHGATSSWGARAGGSQQQRGDLDGQAQPAITI